MDPGVERAGARAVIGTDGSVWNANPAFCALVRLVPPDGSELPTRLRVELVRDSDGRQGWFLVEAWATA